VTTPRSIASLLSNLRQEGRVIPVSAAEVLLLIASGIDNVKDLQQAMPTPSGEPCAASLVARMAALLRGRARYVDGIWIESPFALIKMRRHPHKQGQQFFLSKEGKALISAAFGSEALQRSGNGAAERQHAAVGVEGPTGELHHAS
jgi:hypothetical protein